MKWEDWSVLGKTAWILAGIAVLLVIGGFLLLSGQDRLWVLIPAMLLLVAAIICSLAGAFQAADKSSKG